MRKGVLAGVIIAASACVSAIVWANQNKNEIVGLTPEQVNWFTPPYYTDGRQRARLFGDSTQGGAWIERVKIPPGARVNGNPSASRFSMYLTATLRASVRIRPI